MILESQKKRSKNEAKKLFEETVNENFSKLIKTSSHELKITKKPSQGKYNVN